MRTVCKNCGGDHPVWDCKRPAEQERIVDRVGRSHMTEAHRKAGSGLSSSRTAPALVNNPSSDIRKPGRPRTGFDKLAYNRDYMRKYRAKLKAQKEMEK